jgi:hypothetical protein
MGKPYWQLIELVYDVRVVRDHVFLFFLLPIVLISFQNCSNQSSFEGYNTSVVPVSDGVVGGLNQFEGVRILNADVYMNCFDDHVQMGGVCNTGDSEQNFIRYWMTFNGARVSWGTPPNEVNELDSSKCENGRWTAIVPKPNTNVLNAGTSYLEFEVTFQIFIRAPGSDTFQAGSQTPAYTINIQQFGACTP